MSETTETNALETSEKAPEVNELDLLKSRAKLIGLTFSNNISVETLREKIRAHLEERNAPVSVTPVAAEQQVNALAPEATATAHTPTLREVMVRDQMKLVRLRITNLDPKKKDLPGEVITVANEYLGTVRKFVPFGEVTDNGYHVPYCIYTELESRRFLNIRVIKNPRTGTNRVESALVREFALDILPPLTAEELKQLANAQLASGSTKQEA